MTAATDCAWRFACTACARVRLCVRLRSSAERRLSEPRDQDVRRLRRRRRHRRGGANHGAADGEGSRPDDRGREPHRRQRIDRGPGLGEIAADGYTVMMGSQTDLCGGAGALSQGDHRPGEGFCRRRPHRRLAAGAGGQSVLRRAISGRRDRDGQGKSRQNQFRHRRRRHDTAHDRRTVSTRRRHQDGACRLSWRSWCDQRSGRRANSADVRQPLGCHGPDQSRHAARASRSRAPQRSPSAPDVPTVAETSCRDLPPRPGGASSRRPRRPST